VQFSRQVFKVSDFLSWQRSNSLVLSPSFQRRPVWTSGAKSYLIDTIVRDLPVPVIFVRERIDLKSQQTVREVVDGQQRLRTLFSYIDLSSLPDVDAVRDPFTVRWDHNKDLAGKTFARLPDELKAKILGYEFSTHVFPSSTEDRDLLTIFARINSTGVTLNGQELRNAEYYGQFKQLMYTLAFEQLDRWRKWRIFSEGQIARMAEVELVSDLSMNMMDGLIGKTQTRLDNVYKRYEAEGFPDADALTSRFRRTMDTIDEVLGAKIADSVFSSEVYFFSLFVFLYDELYGLDSELTKGAKAKKLKTAVLGDCLVGVSDRLRREDVPAEVVDAIVRASADTGRRQTRHDFLKAECGSSA
jgi:hypothetical protein